MTAGTELRAATCGVIPGGWWGARGPVAGTGARNLAGALGRRWHSGEGVLSRAVKKAVPEFRRGYIGSSYTVTG